MSNCVTPKTASTTAAVSILFLIVAVALFSASFWTSMPSESVDIGLHYLAVHGWATLTPTTEPTMHAYPPLSHLMVGLFAWAFSLPSFQVMNIAMIVFVLVIYVFVFLGLQRENLLISVVGSATLLVGIFAMSDSSSIYGSEIVGSAFFAQTCGEAAFLAATWFFVVNHERKPSELIVMPIVVLAFVSIYPLTAIKTAAAFCLIWLIYFLKDRQPNWLVVAAILSAIGTAVAIVIHPEFRFMLRVAYNEGGVVPWIGTLSDLLLYNIALLVSSICLLFFARSKPVIFLGIVALASSLIAGLQDFSHAYIYGSEYTVRKHTFAVITLLGAVVISLFMEGAERLAPKLPDNTRPLMAAMAIVWATLATYTVIAPHAKDRSSFLAYQREIQLNPGLIGNAVSQNSEFADWQNYIVTLVDLHTDINLAVNTNMSQHVPYSGRMPDFAVISKSEAVKDGCAIESTLQLSKLIKYQCQ